MQLYSDDSDDSYMTFCSKDCRKRWCEEYDEECEEAYMAAARYVRDIFSWPPDHPKMVDEKEHEPPSEEQVEKVSFTKR